MLVESFLILILIYSSSSPVSSVQRAVSTSTFYSSITLPSALYLSGDLCIHHPLHSCRTSVRTTNLTYHPIYFLDLPTHFTLPDCML